MLPFVVFSFFFHLIISLHLLLNLRGVDLVVTSFCQPGNFTQPTAINRRKRESIRSLNFHCGLRFLDTAMI